MKLSKLLALGMINAEELCSVRGATAAAAAREGPKDRAEQEKDEGADEEDAVAELTEGEDEDVDTDT